MAPIDGQDPKQTPAPNERFVCGLCEYGPDPDHLCSSCADKLLARHNKRVALLGETP
jgi:ribosomal protein S27AE